ncbi:MAG: hypothetical protein ACOY3P_24070 [Planctomycetota bacterium]
MSAKCRSCLLPAAVPGANLDAATICAHCRGDAERGSSLVTIDRDRRIADLRRALRDCRGAGEYDCIVMLSGGKDSCYLLHRIVRDEGLNPLAFTVNVNLPEVAWRNIHRTVEQLGVHHLVYTPPREVYRKLFRFLLQNQESRGAVRTVCYVCAPLTEGYALKLAVEKGIPLILAGYSPGQPEPERMEYEFSRAMISDEDWTPPEVRESGLFSEAELSLFWNPHRYPAGTAFPRYLAPFHAWDYDQEQVMKSVVELGLVRNRRSANPIYTNCPVNWLLMYSDLKNLGYNPYAPEFAALIREGKARRWYWKLMGPVVDFMIRRRVLMGRNVTTSMEWLGLGADELRITREASTETEHRDKQLHAARV